MPRSKKGSRAKRSIAASLGSTLWARGITLRLAVVAAPILVFSLSVVVRNWLLGVLGYGLIPVTAWIVCFLLVLRYKNEWIPRYSRAWLGSALLVAVSLGIMSMFHASSGVMKGASLGGYWSQYIGGGPLPLGAFKVAVLILLVPLILFPRPSSTAYVRVARRILLVSAIVLLWLWVEAQQFGRALAARRFSGPTGYGPGRYARRFSLSFRRSWRSTFGVSRARPRPLPSVAGSVGARRSRRQRSVHEGRKGVRVSGGWQLPSIELLSKGEDRPVPSTVLDGIARHIEETLMEHRVEVAVKDVRTGPRVIRFGLVPGWMKNSREAKGTRTRGTSAPNIEMSRVKVQSILMREKDLALALKTPYLRLEAPVPGESLVGLEMPSPYPRTVVLRSVAESPPFQKIAAKGGLPIALGEDTAGEPVVADLTDLPHILIAGATGGGKSVCINSMVASLLLTRSPNKLRFLMVDPKRVELTPFNGIPHLLAPVIVNSEEVLAVLKGVQDEMFRRYRLMEDQAVRNIEGYNKKASDPLPLLVIVIDELADLMMAAAYETEQALVRLAQLGRATGIHLILATQRPSVNVVTGLLKANIPARIAFAVASQVDSRVILDSVGAERLLSKGDMLLLTSDSPKPRRVQGTFVHDREIEKLVEFWRIQSGPPLDNIPLQGSYPDASGNGFDEDELLDQARELAGRYRHISPSVLQRRLQVGYARAMRLMDLLEQEGSVVGSPQLSEGS